jgi:hypothetical protein
MQRQPTSMSALDTLLELNREYIRSVQHSDVQRFTELLAEDFLCSNPDGSLVDREHFFAQAAQPVSISNLEARDVVVRIMEDFAIIHARTTYIKLDRSPGAGRYRYLGSSQWSLARRLRARHAMLSPTHRNIMWRQNAGSGLGAVRMRRYPDPACQPLSHQSPGRPKSKNRGQYSASGGRPGTGSSGSRSGLLWDPLPMTCHSRRPSRTVRATTPRRHVW